MTWTPDDGAADWGDSTKTKVTFNDENVDPATTNGGQDWNAPASNGFAAYEPGAADDFKPAATDGEKADGNCCRNCGADDHFARNCPEPRKDGSSMACFNCGEEGHTKAECTKPRVFKGTCRLCSKEGHPASQCPDKPADVCKNCKSEGHRTMDCKENRKFDLNHVPDKLPEEAWDLLKKASDEEDLEDFREGIQVYSKAVPEATFADIEKKMRNENFKFYLIGMEKPVGDCISLINLQGKLNCQYVVGFYFSPKPQRANLRERWPASPEENLDRLENAGLPYDREIPKCSNCGEMGHTARGCQQERVEIERVEVKCVNCSGIGHRARDCPEERRDMFACRNCGQSDHKASDCPNPRSADGVECRKCNEVGHFAKDCPKAAEREPRTCRNCGSEEHIARDCDQPRNPDTVTCRNCDEVGHFSRDCTKKKDWSKVKCNNCGEMGHTIKRCPVQSTDNNNDTTDFNAAPSGDGDWNAGSAPEETQQESGGGGWNAEASGW